ncbi:MAG: hypothetical protein AAFX93_12685 [Verrucomicrobiota bacterium]
MPATLDKPKAYRAPKKEASAHLRALIEKIDDLGELPITKCDESNVPLNIVISEPDEFNARWILLADNFKPLNATIDIETYEVEADSKEVLMEIVHEIILPLYQAAVFQLENRGTCFFWSKDKVSA